MYLTQRIVRLAALIQSQGYEATACAGLRDGMEFVRVEVPCDNEDGTDGFYVVQVATEDEARKSLGLVS